VSRASLTSIFIHDAAISDAVVRLAPSIALFQVLDGYQGVAGGILRGLGRQPLIAAVNLVAFWLIGIPVGSVLAFGSQLGVVALWWGLSLGLLVGSLTFAWVISRIDWQGEAQIALLRAAIEPDASALERSLPLLG